MLQSIKLKLSRIRAFQKMINKANKTSLIWEKVQEYWPAPLPDSEYSEPLSFNMLKEKMENFLIEMGVAVQGFSHFGLVVNSIEGSVDILKKYDRGNFNDLKKVWVDAYLVHIGRIIFDGKELEFISPAGKSFFKTFLNEEGEGLHHIAFEVDNIDNHLERLKTHGVELIDKEPRCGSHGKVAFLMPGLFGRMCIELFQKYT
jgi:methylmalonyl-CoA/ethylmalonyl-CoA epimerase